MPQGRRKAGCFADSLFTVPTVEFSFADVNFEVESQFKPTQLRALPHQQYIVFLSCQTSHPIFHLIYSRDPFLLSSFAAPLCQPIRYLYLVSSCSLSIFFAIKAL